MDEVALGPWDKSFIKGRFGPCSVRDTCDSTVVHLLLSIFHSMGQHPRAGAWPHLVLWHYSLSYYMGMNTGYVQGKNEMGQGWEQMDWAFGIRRCKLLY